MNVLHLDEQRGWRGGEQQAAWLVAGLRDRSHQVVLAGRRESAFLDHFAKDAAIPQYRLGFRSEVDLFSVRRLARIIRDHQIEIIHAHTSHAHTFACLARWWAGRGKVVVSRRVSYPPRQDVFNRWKYRIPDQFIAVSQRVAEVLSEAGIPADQVTRVYSSVDLARVVVPAASRVELGAPEDALLLLSAGALVEQKDHATLLDALPAVLAEAPEVFLVIAGEGALRAALEAQIERLGLNARVRLLGHRSDVPALMRASDLYVSSSISEGLGTSVLEALASETPVVATVAGGVGEMILDGETGYLVPHSEPAALAQAMVRSLQDRERAREMAVRGRQHVEAHFTVDRMIEGTLQVYERLLKEQQP